MKRCAMSAMALSVFMLSFSANAGRDKKEQHTVCHYAGMPVVERFDNNSITVNNKKFKFSKAEDLQQFQAMLYYCNAYTTWPTFMEWWQAQQLVVAKSAQIAAQAIQTGAQIYAAPTDAEKKKIAAEAAERAAALTAELIPLRADAEAKQKMFLALFMGTVPVNSAPEATPQFVVPQ